jgi:pyruvyltransferase
LVTVKRRTHNLGILPHWSDDVLATDPRFAKYHPLVIDPGGDPLDVVRAIGSCHKIVTSSLHGAVVADSFGIPRRIEVAPTFAKGNEGGMFKFRDYNASVGVPHRVGVTQRAEKQNVETIQHILFDLYDSLGDYL